MRPLAASTAAPPAGDAETAMQSSGASRELVPSPRPRPRAQIASAPGAQHAQSLKFQRRDIAAGWSH